MMADPGRPEEPDDLTPPPFLKRPKPAPWVPKENKL